MIRPFTVAVAAMLIATSVSAAEPPDFVRDVQPLLTKYCAGCHNAADAELNGEFALHDFAALMKGGTNGAAIVPGNVDQSRLVALIERRDEPAMPPEDEPAPSADEIAILKAWIAAGAKGPAGHDVPMLVLPTIATTGTVRQPVHAAAWSPDGTTLAVGRYESIELLGDDGKPRSTLTGLAGQVSVVAFLAGDRLFAAGGVPGIAGEVGVWDRKSNTPVWTKPAHRDAVTCGTVSPDGRILATGSYDQSIILWDAATGEPTATLTGHNGPVFGLAFHPNKPILASASGDRTVKLWNTETGDRLDTLIEPTKEQIAIAFSPDGSRLAAGGADNRVRLWSIREGAADTNVILYSQFVHEGPIIALAYSRDGRLLVTASEDRTVKIWNANSMTQLSEPLPQSDWVAAIAVHPTQSRAALGRLDGSVEAIDLPQAASSDGSPGSAGIAPVVAMRPDDAAAETPMPPAVAEVEPNDDVKNATELPLPGVATGVLHRPDGDGADVDAYRIRIAAGEAWVIETNAAQSKSPADTKIDVLHPDGSPVERVRLRAVRDSAINFRPMNPEQPTLRVDYWEEMELNEYMYLSGEVCRIFRMPQGPDSDMRLYDIGNKRRSYFDTTPIAHALFEAVYIVEPHPPGTQLPANGLPVFSVPFENDDASDRSLGRDSRLTFTAPADGEYLIRVRDARSFGGEKHTYTLTARRPRPDFNVSIVEKERAISVGCGQKVTLKVDRIDGFEGPVRIDVNGLPPGLTASTPVIIEGGHESALFVLNASSDAVSPSDEAFKAISVSASASVDGRLVVKPVAGLAKLTVGEPPKARVTMTGADGAGEVVLRPGQSVTAMLSIERNNFDGQLNFDVENLPHGVIVDHIGLSGVLIRKGEIRREIVFSCADWVPATSRQIFAVARGQGDPSSSPIELRVERAAELAQGGE